MPDPKLYIRKPVWKELMKELHGRGKGARETGAFLLGDKGDNTVSHFICYDDLDPSAFYSGIIIFNGDGFIPLWQHCADKGMKVLADVHTHPDEWTGQSASDQKHPMIAQAGHIAFIIPHYAMEKNQWLNGVGVHEFLGNRRWRSHDKDSGIIKFIP